jgi:hypothetical protein
MQHDGAHRFIAILLLDRGQELHTDGLRQRIDRRVADHNPRNFAVAPDVDEDAHWPLKRAVRFSKNAWTPSRKSAEAPSSC